jgi:hypothetical protein
MWQRVAAEPLPSQRVGLALITARGLGAVSQHIVLAKRPLRFDIAISQYPLEMPKSATTNWRSEQRVPTTLASADP